MATIVMVVGLPTVGKSCIVKRFLGDGTAVSALSNYVPTKFDIYTRSIMTNYGEAKVEIFDTAGMSNSLAHRDALYSKANGFLLVFSLTDLCSFHDLESIKKRIDITTPNASIILVGNKNDVLDQKRQVRHEDAVRCSKEWGCQYVETSALLDYNIDTAFKELVTVIKSKQTVPAKAKKKCKLMRLFSGFGHCH